jgi:hypothetical protein
MRRRLPGNGGRVGRNRRGLAPVILAAVIGVVAVVAVVGGLFATGVLKLSSGGGTTVTYAVTFTESGLPLGTNWSVDLNGTISSSVGTTIVFSEPAGSYGFTVSAVLGYYPDPVSGTVTVSSKAVSEPVTFSAAYSLAMVPEGQSAPGAGTYYVTLAIDPTSGLTTSLFGMAITNATDVGISAGAVPSSCDLYATLSFANCAKATAASQAWYVVLVATNNTIANAYGSAGWTSPSIALNAGLTMVVITGATVSGIGCTLEAYGTGPSLVSGSTVL